MIDDDLLPPGSTIEQFHEVRGIRVRSRSSGTGPAILLLHGLGAGLEMWEPVLDWLDGRRVIRIDVPGTGGSGRPSSLWSMRRYADLVEAVLGALYTGRVDVLGFSFGGMLAQELAHRHPDRVATLTLVGTSCGWGSLPGTPLATVAIATPLRYFSPMYMRLVAPVLYGGRASGEGDLGPVQMEARQRHPPSIVGYYSQLFAVWTWSSLPFLHRLRVPVLVVAGSADPVIPVANSWQLHFAIRASRLVEIAGGGHLCMLDSPAQVMPAVADFLAEHPRTESDR